MATLMTIDFVKPVGKQMPKRAEITIEESFVLFRGVNPSDIRLYGPFETEEEAFSYGDKSFPDDTKTIAKMRKEVVTHGEE